MVLMRFLYIYIFSKNCAYLCRCKQGHIQDFEEGECSKCSLSTACSNIHHILITGLYFVDLFLTQEQNLSRFSLAGMSRSVTVTIAYIMSVTSLNWKEALKVVRVGRAIANPNNGFQKQLQDFECFRLADVSCFISFFILSIYRVYHKAMSSGKRGTV